MLSNDVPATPRARPPAHARRSVSMQVKPSPPPPYAAAAMHRLRMATLETLSASPIGTPSREGNSDAGQTPFDVEQQSWLKEASRDELANLLTKAKKILMERENQLAMTSSLCKSLHGDSVSLRMKHRAPLAGISGSSEASMIDLHQVPAPLRTSQSHNSTLTRSAISSFVETPTASPKGLLGTRRSRKLSVSPSDIALLSDQNAELLHKLEKVEAESRQADQEGRRALKRLEKEIQGLREELEATQARSEELEEKTKQGFDKGVENVIEEVLKRKQDKVAKIRALRGKCGDAGSGEDGEYEVKNFAPSRVAVVPWSPKQFRSLEVPDAAATETATTSTLDILHSPGHRVGVNTSLQRAPPGNMEENAQQGAPESMDAQVERKQPKTPTKLRPVQEDAGDIVNFCECLGDPANVEREVTNDSYDKSKPVLNPPADDTIRFRRLRGTLDNTSKFVTNRNDDRKVFGGGLAADNYSTVHGNFQLKTGSYKQRKSVVGLFDPEAEGNDSPMLGLSHPVEHADANGLQRCWSADVTSPALSLLSLSATPVHTLRSELGSEFGEDWGKNAGNHHLRATSLGDLTDMNIGQRSPSPMPSLESSLQEQEHNGLDTVMQLSFEAPTECPKVNTDAAEDACRSKYRRISQTIRSRTSRWVDGRYKEVVPRSSKASPSVWDSEEYGTRSEVTDTVRMAVDPVTVTTSQGQALTSSNVEGMMPQFRESAVTNSGRREKVTLNFLLEIWLWLQFAMIILVFLWAMARRGPKSVLEDAEQRRRARLRPGGAA